jgi:hypothetical protein
MRTHVQLYNCFRIDRWSSVAFFTLLAWSNSLPQQPSSAVSTVKQPTMALISFKGDPQGGGLKLWIKGKTLVIDTKPHEDTGQIATRAAGTINADTELKAQKITAEAQGQKLKIHVNEVWVYLCADDKGLNVPPAPQELRLEKSPDGITHLNWKVPQSGYDRIHILRGMVPIADGIDGSTTRFSEFAMGEKMSYAVFGIKDGTPSCAATY